MFILHLVLFFGTGSGANSAQAVFTGEYRTFAACHAASGAIQKASGRSAEFVTCTPKG